MFLIFISFVFYLFWWLSRLPNPRKHLPAFQRGQNEAFIWLFKKKLKIFIGWSSDLIKYSFRSRENVPLWLPTTSWREPLASTVWSVSRTWSTRSWPLDPISSTPVTFFGPSSWTLPPEDGGRKSTTSLKVINVANMKCIKLNNRLLFCDLSFYSVVRILIWSWVKLFNYFFLNKLFPWQRMF